LSNSVGNSLIKLNGVLGVLGCDNLGISSIYKYYLYFYSFFITFFITFFIHPSLHSFIIHSSILHYISFNRIIIA
jgi:hypothetical protein